MLAINTCPRKETGAIAGVLNQLLDGLKEAGAEVELFYGSDLLIFPCCGNLNCTIRTPGQCMAWDDMRWLRPKIGRADVLVLASPLYFNGHSGVSGVTEPLKRLQDRLARCRDMDDRPCEHAVHTTREPVNLRKVVIVSGCGLLEIDGFYPVLTHLKAFCYNSFPELAGCINGIHGIKTRDFPGDASPEEIAIAAHASGKSLASDFRGLPAAEALAMACDGGSGSPAMRREWEAVTLFEFGTMH